MKKIQLLCIMIFTIGGISCTNYLDVKDKTEIIPETAEEFASLLHQHLDDIDAAYDYEILGEYTTTLSYEGYSDNLDGDLNQTDRIPLYVGEDINTFSYRYEGLYEIIKDCNIILDNLKERDTELGRKVIAVAHAMRGVCYFNLMRAYCEPFDAETAETMNGLPLVEEFDMEGKPARSTMRETVEFIVKDLETAISLNQVDKKYWFDVDVCKFYLARTYFWAEEWEKTIKIAGELLETYPLLEGAAYEEMMKSEVKLAGNELMRSGTAKGSSYTNLSFGYSQLRPVSEDLYNLFVEKENDIRYNLYFTAKRTNNKVLRSVLRTDEMCLVLAEAYAHLGNTTEALRYLNHLREHRISPYTPYTESTLPAIDENTHIKVDASGTPLSPLMAAILNERRKEFYMENGDRWFELKRNGCPEFWWGYSGVKFQTSKYLYTFPIPKKDIELNPALEQNPGYENL